MNWNELLSRIPFLAPLGMEITEDGEGVTHVQLPFREGVTNHVGTLHAGALFTVAETAAGVAAWKVVPGEQAAVLLRSSSVRYTRRAAGKVTASARADESAAEEARAAFETAQRADLVVEATVEDGDGETVFVGSFDYALRPRKALAT